MKKIILCLALISVSCFAMAATKFTINAPHLSRDIWFNIRVSDNINGFTGNCNETPGDYVGCYPAIDVTSFSTILNMFSNDLDKVGGYDKGYVQICSGKDGTDPSCLTPLKTCSAKLLGNIKGKTVTISETLDKQSLTCAVS